jgi:transposase
MYRSKGGPLGLKRFSSIKKAISDCSLCGAEKSSGSTVQRAPLSKQRNKYLQTGLSEAAKMAPRYSLELALLYDKEKRRGNANRAALAVARVRPVNVQEMMDNVRSYLRITQARPTVVKNYFCERHVRYAAS